MENLRQKWSARGSRAAARPWHKTCRGAETLKARHETRIQRSQDTKATSERLHRPRVPVRRCAVDAHEARAVRKAARKARRITDEKYEPKRTIITTMPGSVCACEKMRDRVPKRQRKVKVTTLANFPLANRKDGTTRAVWRRIGTHGHLTRLTLHRELENATRFCRP